MSTSHHGIQDSTFTDYFLVVQDLLRTILECGKWRIPISLMDVLSSGIDKGRITKGIVVEKVPKEFETESGASSKGACAGLSRIVKEPEVPDGFGQIIIDEASCINYCHGRYYMAKEILHVTVGLDALDNTRPGTPLNPYAIRDYGEHSRNYMAGEADDQEALRAEYVGEACAPELMMPYQALSIAHRIRMRSPWKDKDLHVSRVFRVPKKYVVKMLSEEHTNAVRSFHKSIRHGGPIVPPEFDETLMNLPEDTPENLSRKIETVHMNEF
jgi:hypothetical protein